MAKAATTVNSPDTFKIDVHHPRYDEFVDAWQIMRDTIGGEDDVKDKGTTYLPLKSGMAAIDDEKLRMLAYNGYRMRAEFPELVAPTISGCAGLICAQPPTYTLPDKMKYILEDATGEGTTLDSLHRTVVTEILSMGRYGLLPGPSANNPGEFGIAGYRAEQIINWDREAGRVNYVVLDETDEQRDPDTNEWGVKRQFLECKFDGNNYSARRWSEAGSSYSPSEDLTALKSGNSPLGIMPFVFISTANLKPEPDDTPMYGLAKIALRIYRIDADYQHGMHMTSEPTPWVSGFDDASEAIKSNAVPRTIGASNIWILPKDAQAGYLEFQGAGLTSQQTAIRDGLERATMFGAQLLSENSKNAESGDSRRMRLQGQHSLMRTIAMTAAAAIERVLRNIAIWSDVNPNEVIVRPFLDFMDHTLEAQDIAALVAGWQSGAYSKRTLFESLQRADMIPSERTFEQEQDLIDEEGDPLAVFGRDTGAEDVKFGAGAGVGAGVGSSIKGT